MLTEKLPGHDPTDHAIEKEIEQIAVELGYQTIYACLQSHWGPHSEERCNIFSARYQYDGYYDKDEVRTAYAEGRIVEWLETTLIQAQILGELSR